MKEEVRVIILNFKPIVVFFDDNREDLRNVFKQFFGIFIEADVEKYDIILSKNSEPPVFNNDGSISNIMKTGATTDVLIIDWEHKTIFSEVDSKVVFNF